MKEIFDTKLFSFDGHNFNVAQLLLVLFIFLVAATIYFFIRSFIHRKFREKDPSNNFQRFLAASIGWFIIILSVIVSAKLIDMPVKSLLHYQIYANGDKIHITVAHLIAATLIFFFIRIILFLIEYVINKRIIRTRIDKRRGNSLMLIVKYVVWIIGGSVIFSTLGFRITFLIASVSALLVGVGFGLQGIFNDILSGIIILFDGSVEVDDVVELDGVVGRVKKIGIRVSEILTRDNVVMIIPNSKFTGDKVINWTHNDDSTRFYVEVGVAYGSDVRLVEKILLECAFAHNRIEKKPSPFVRFKNFGESSLDFQLFFWTRDDFFVEFIKSDLRFEIDKRFRENKVEIPFPQRDIHFKSKSY